MSERQGESVAKGVTARLFYRLLRWLADIEVTSAAGEFRLVDQRALSVFRSMPESNRYLRGMFSWIGFRQTGVRYVSPPRTVGHSKYTTRRMVRLAFDAIVGFSQRPLRLALSFGFFVSLASVVFGLSAVAVKLAGGFVVPPAGHRSWSSSE